MKNLIYNLKEMADIRTGYSFRSKLEQDLNGNVLVVQLKELSEKNTIDLSTAVKINMQELSENYILKKDDLVFRSRGLDMTAAIMTEETDNAILSAPFQRIRINNVEQILAEYLLWYINSKEAQAYFAMNKTGTSVSMVSTAVLADLPVTIPPIDMQKKIIEINKLSVKEIELQEELIKKKKLLTETVLLNVIRP